ncbi:isoleucine--tRNA ligase [Alloprevotella sp. OH1205_COT-284]|uniref:isoleucine--tRNA ligase n=1 Tax=Alloprevotella sp. OH1205_COT-284 TaxID=2491043 RepID=UPI000F5E48EC|nr:isoleucine--tRNA ligase [Alloprevotella sp. OH1205_COT-284]RRD77410.1 isoleucine--tRNA ligase [Alloprevotella sp. OH1205_COT-284]
MSKKFVERSAMNLYAVNEEILKDWEKADLFHKSMSEREGCPSYVFFEGPPSANGHPGIHHVMARTIKDVFCRYKTMQGFQVKRKAGWDTHGLPVELGVEKELGITKEDIGSKVSIEEYNAHCRRNVMMFTQEWTDLSHLMGYWVDMENPYVTYENSYIETLWWLLSRLYEKGLLYKGFTIQPYSPAAGTGLSSHELNQPGCYRDVKDTTVTAQFEIVNPLGEMQGWGRPVFLAWTTTPWTLPSNTALCVGAAIDYVAIRTFNPYNAEPITAVVAESRLAAYFKPEGIEAEMVYQPGDKVLPYRISGRYKGSDLVGISYSQLMPWIKPSEKLDDVSPAFVTDYAEQHPEKQFAVGRERFVEMADCAFRVISGDFVTTDDGTGIVHIAPTFGADDAKVAKAAGVPSLFIINAAGETRPMVDLTGKYYTKEECADEFVARCLDVDAYARHAGDYVKNAYDPRFNINGKYDESAAAKAEDLNIVICMEMKQEGSAFKIEKHVHNYPHCWRTDKPVLYYPLDSWFIRTTALKERMLELNQTILWKPESTGTGRFGKWLENLNDWNLSRSRYWGTPLPIWRNAETREEICIGSLQQLFDEIEKSVSAGIMKNNPLKEKGFVPGDYSDANYRLIDLHRPYVDNIVLVSESGNPLYRETDLIDVWFDSGAMPYAQVHYPFENKEELDKRNIYPADFIAEGVDQTRGWFFTLHAIATMVFDSVAFKAVISNGLVLDKNGQKMSKRLGNAVDPFEAIKKYGSDPVRWYMITNSSPWDNLKFDPEGVVETSRTFFGKLFQTYSFFSMYANVDGFDPEAKAVPMEQRPEIDRWILSELNSLIREVTACYEDYEPTKAGRLIQTFTIDNLSNWYVRLNRKRYWAGEMTTDKHSAYQTLYTCLLTLSKLMAPIAPFYADRLYKDLAEGTVCAASESVHLDSFPTVDESLIDSELEARMKLAQQATSLVLSLRKKEKIIVRQPLRKIAIPITDTMVKERLEKVKQLILDEVNVKEIEFVEGQMLEKRVKCNFRVMGKKFGKIMKAVNEAVISLSQEEIAELEKGSISLNVEGQDCLIERSDVEIVSEDMPGWSVANEGTLTVALDITITEGLKSEGIAREIIKRVQSYRKESGFDITDRIDIVMQSNEAVEKAVAGYRELICSQVLAQSFTCASHVDSATIFDFDGEQVKVIIEKV